MRFILIPILFIFTACVPAMTQQQWSQVDFGSKPEGSVYLETIEQSIKAKLIDPDSLKLTCAGPRKGSVGEAFSSHRFGWVVYCSVNAKNRLGGYAGAKPYVYLFQGNRLITAQDYGDATEGYEYKFMP